MDSPEIGARLGTMLNSHAAYTPQQKGEAAAEIVIYIRQLEQRIEALESELQFYKKRCGEHWERLRA